MNVNTVNTYINLNRIFSVKSNANYESSGIDSPPSSKQTTFARKKRANDDKQGCSPQRLSARCLQQLHPGRILQLLHSQGVQLDASQQRLANLLNGPPALANEDINVLTTKWLSELPEEVVRKLKAQFLNQLSLSQISGLHTGWLNPAEVGRLDEQHFNQVVTREWLLGLPEEEVRSLGAPFLNRLNRDQIRGIRAEWLNPGVATGLGEEQFSFMERGDVQNLSSDFLRNIPTGTLHSLVEGTRAALRNPAFSYDHYRLSANEYQWRAVDLSTPYQVFLLDLTASQLHELRNQVNVLLEYPDLPPRIFAILGILNQEQVRGLSDRILSSLTASNARVAGRLWSLLDNRQRALIPGVASEVLRENARYAAVVGSWTREEAQQKSIEDLLKLPKRSLTFISRENLALLPWDQFPPTFWQDLREQLEAAELEYIVSSLPRERISALPENLWNVFPFEYVSVAAAPGIPSGVFSSMGTTTLLQRTWTPAHYAAFRAEQISRFYAPVLRDLDGAQIRAISPQVFERLTGEQLVNFVERTRGFHFSEAQWQRVTPQNLGRLNAIDFAVLWRSFRSEQYQWWTPDQIAAVFRLCHLRMLQSFFPSLEAEAGTIEWQTVGITLRGNATPQERQRYREVLQRLSANDIGIMGERFPLYHRNRITLYEFSGEFFRNLNVEAHRAVPAEFFASRSSRYIEELTRDQRRYLRGPQVGNMHPDTFAAFAPQDIPDLSAEVFGSIMADQLRAWLPSRGQTDNVRRQQEQRIRAITREQLRSIPVRTLENMGREDATEFYRLLTASQRNGLTDDQLRFFEGLIQQSADQPDKDNNRPSGGGGSGGTSGTGRNRNAPEGGTGGGTSGGARPKDPDTMQRISKLGRSKNRGPLLPFISLEDIKNQTWNFWNETLGPEVKITAVPSKGNSGFPAFVETPIGFEEYKQMIRRGIRLDQMRALPTKVLPYMNLYIMKAFSPLQITKGLSAEQRNAIEASFIQEKILQERNLEALFNILKLNKQGTVTPSEYKKLIDQANRRDLRNQLTPDVIRELGKDPDSYLLYYLEPVHFFNHGENDWSPRQITALPETIITKAWGADHFNQLTPEQFLAIKVQYFSDISGPVIAGWKRQCFDFPTKEDLQSLEVQGYRERVRALGEKVKYISLSAVRELPSRVFTDYMTPDQFLQLSKDQRQQIVYSRSSMDQFPIDFFVRLVNHLRGTDEKNKLREIVSDLTEAQTKAIINILTTTISGLEVTEKASIVQFLNAFQSWQVPLVTNDLLRAIPFSDFAPSFLNSLTIEQIQNSSAVQIGSITSKQARELSDFIINVGDKYQYLNPAVFRDEKAVEKLWTYAAGEQLSSNREQIKNVVLSKVSTKSFESAFRKGGMAFTKLLTPRQIEDLDAERLRIINNLLYGILLVEIGSKMSDVDIRERTENINRKEYLTVLNIIKRRYAYIGKEDLRDWQRREILKGTLRPKMVKNEKFISTTMSPADGLGGVVAQPGRNPIPAVRMQIPVAALSLHLHDEL